MTCTRFLHRLGALALLALAAPLSHAQEPAATPPLRLLGSGTLLGGFSRIGVGEVPTNQGLAARIETGVRDDRVWLIYITFSELPPGASWARQTPEMLAKAWPPVARRAISWGVGSSLAHGPFALSYRTGELIGSGRPHCLFASGTDGRRRLDVRACSRTTLGMSEIPGFLRAIDRSGIVQGYLWTPPPSPPAAAPLAMPSRSGQPVARAEPEQFNRAVEQGVVQNLALMGGNKLSEGTGTVVAPGRVLTNRHVVNGAERLLIASRSFGFIRPASLLANDLEPGSDLALLSVEAPELVALPLALADREENVLAAGYPISVVKAAAGNRPIDITRPDRLPITALRIGAVLSVQNDSEGVEVVTHSATIEPGNSGGPLLDRCGRVTGINQRLVIDTRTHAQTSVALSAREAARFLAITGLNTSVNGDTCL